MNDKVHQRMIFAQYKYFFFFISLSKIKIKIPQSFEYSITCRNSILSTT